MTTMDHLDPFETHTSLPDKDTDPERITAGRYRLPDLTIRAPGVHPVGTSPLITGTGPRKGGWQRVTTMVKAIADARALDLWHQRQLITGMVLRPDLYDLACATLSGRKLDGSDPDLREDLEDLASRILLAAGADVGANLGTAFHGFAEAQDLGMMHYARKRWHGRLANYASGLERHRLEVVQGWTERRVVVLKYGLAGTLDRILHDQALDIPGVKAAPVYRIGDLKSQKRFWTWLEISAQLAAYQMADAMWDRASASYIEMPKVADDFAVVAWVPEVHPDPERADGVDFFDVDLSKGREVLDLSHTVDRLRAEAKSKAQTIGLLRPAPEMSIVESYARRLDTVESLAEGSALWAEITSRGLADTPELIEVARANAGRLS